MWTRVLGLNGRAPSQHDDERGGGTTAVLKAVVVHPVHVVMVKTRMAIRRCPLIRDERGTFRKNQTSSLLEE